MNAGYSVHTCDACEITTWRLGWQYILLIILLIHLQLATNGQNNNRFVNNYYIIKSMSFLEQHVKNGMHFKLLLNLG